MSAPIEPTPPATTAKVISDVQLILAQLSRKLSEQSDASVAVGHRYREMIDHATSQDREAHKASTFAFFDARRQQHAKGIEAMGICNHAQSAACAARILHSKEAEANAATLASMISLYRVGGNARKKAHIALTHEYARLSQEKTAISKFNIEARTNAEREANDLRVQLAAVKAELEEAKRLASYQATLLSEKSEPCAGCKRKREGDDDVLAVSVPEPPMSPRTSVSASGSGSSSALKPGSEDILLLSPILDGSYPDPPLTSEQKVFSFDLDITASLTDAFEGPTKKQKVGLCESSSGVPLVAAIDGHSSEDL